MVTELSFRPGPLAAPLDYRLAGARLSCSKGGTRQWSLDLSQVGDAVLVEHRARRMLSRRLDLKGPEGWRSVAANFPMDEPADPDRVAHRRLIAAVAAALPAELSVGIGERGIWRHAWFGIGILALAIGAGILLAAILTGAESDRILVALVPLLFMAGFGYVVMMANAPWRPLPRLPARELAQALSPPETDDGEPG